MTDRKLHVSHLKISNILGIDALEFSPEGFNEIRGKNGEGKTSVLEAIKAATGQGHDATLLRKGSTEGEVVLVLDNGAEIKKRVTDLRSTTSITDADGRKVTRPAEFMKSLVDSLSVNPVAFLTAQPKDRVKVLLEAMPIVIDVERLESFSGIPPIDDGSIHGLAIIDEIRSRVYADRTGTNRAVKEKDATINQLQLAMPDVPGGAEGNEDALRLQVEEATTKKDAELNRVRDKLDGIKKENQTEIDRLRTEAQTKVDAIRTEAQRQIDEIKAKGIADVEEINGSANTAIENIQASEREWETRAGQQREKTIQAHTETVGPVNQTLEAIRTNRSAHAKREQALETIKLMEKELEDLKNDAAAQTKALEDIDAYKLELLAALPIPGVEVRDGEIYRGGVVFDRLNTAQQVEIAVEIAKLRTGDLGICCVDRLECLDPDAFAAFRTQVLESGMQLFVTTVNGEEFNVQSTAQPA